MFNYLIADMGRVLRKKSYIILTSFVLALFAVTLIILLLKSPGNVGLASSFLETIAVLFIGISVFAAVFTDDFKSKAMQSIIGLGTSRRRLVVSRYCEYLMILAQAFLVISLLSLILFIATGQISVAATLFRELWKGYLFVALCVTVAMMFVYGSQNPTLGLVVFVILIANLLDFILAGISFIPFFADHNINLSLILPSNLLYQAIDNGKPVFFVFAIIGYIVLPLFISVKAFERKELEF